MLKFTSLDLQQQTGDIQRAVAKEPVLITSYGKARSVMISAEEYCRLKSKAGEPVPSELTAKRAVTVRERTMHLLCDPNTARSRTGVEPQRLPFPLNTSRYR